MNRDEYLQFLSETFEMTIRTASIQASCVFREKFRREGSVSWQDIYDAYINKTQSVIREKLVEIALANGAIGHKLSYDDELQAVALDAMCKGENINKYSHLEGSDYEKYVQILMLENPKMKIKKAWYLAERAIDPHTKKIKTNSKYAKYFS